MRMLRIALGDPEQWFMLVHNSGSVTMTPGYAAVFDFAPAGGTTRGNNGYAVRYARTDQPTNAGLFAGVVAGNPIPPGGWGSVQIWGYHTSVWVCGISGTGFFNQATTTLDTSSLAKMVFRPVGDESGGWTGLFGCVTNPVAMASNVVRNAVNGVIPVDYIIPYGANTYGTLTTIEAQHPTTPAWGTCKAFIRVF